jgi:cell division protein FtsB
MITQQKGYNGRERFMKNKIMWKDVTLIVLAILLIFSMCRIHTLKQSNKKLYSQNLELNHQLATLKEKNTGLESKLNSEESITDEKKSDNSQH